MAEKREFRALSLDKGRYLGLRIKNLELESESDVKFARSRKRQVKVKGKNELRGMFLILSFFLGEKIPNNADCIFC